MAQRFSLKDNPIFQKFTPRTLPDAITPVEETRAVHETASEGQYLTVKERLSEDDTHLVLTEKASGSSPSVDIFTSSGQQIVPVREDPQEREEMHVEGQHLTVKERLSEDDAQKFPPTRMSDSSPPPLFSTSSLH